MTVVSQSSRQEEAWLDQEVLLLSTRLDDCDTHSHMLLG